MDASKNPDYLRATARSVADFRDALEQFLVMHVVNDFVARGIAPAVFPLPGADPEKIKVATSKVDIASGRASAAAGLTNCFFNVQGIGVIDPIVAWHTITKPKPLLEPDSILSVCSQMIGRLDQMTLKAEAEAPQRIGVEAMHPLIWHAANRLWGDRHYRQAVAAASESLVSRVKVRTGRNDVAETALWTETFSDKPPARGKPRLRWPGNQANRDVRAMNDGLRQFAPGVQMTIRNAAVHGTDDIAEQDALERLGVLSVLAR